MEGYTVLVVKKEGVGGENGKREELKRRVKVGRNEEAAEIQYACKRKGEWKKAEAVRRRKKMKSYMRVQYNIQADMQRRRNKENGQCFEEETCSKTEKYYKREGTEKRRGGNLR